MKWHATLRQRLVRTGAKESCYEEKWGDYKPHQRLNIDQSPLPFAIECKKTYDIPDKDEKVWVNQPTPDAGKRFCSLNICFSPDGTQPRIAVISRGKGKQIAAEKEAWDPDIDVYFQPNAWTDGGFCTEWAKRTRKPAVQGKHHFVLICDNLEGQKNPEFKDAVRLVVAYCGIVSRKQDVCLLLIGQMTKLFSQKVHLTMLWLLRHC